MYVEMFRRCFCVYRHMEIDYIDDYSHFKNTRIQPVTSLAIGLFLRIGECSPL